MIQYKLKDKMTNRRTLNGMYIVPISLCLTLDVFCCATRKRNS